MTIQDRKGSMIVSTLISISLLGAAFWAYSLYQTQSIRRMQLLRQRLHAEAHAAELLEFFRSLSSTQLKTYLSKNPISGDTSVAKQYPLCAHINLLDRGNSTSTDLRIMNEDPLATLSNTVTGPARLDGCSGNAIANRYYQVDVVDTKNNFDRVQAACDSAPSAYTLAAHERYLVRVGVSWVSCLNKLAEPEHIVISTVIPQ